MPPVSLLLPAGPDTHQAVAENRLENGPFGRLKQVLAKASSSLPPAKTVGFAMALASMAAPTAAMACDIRDGIPAEPSRHFEITAPGVPARDHLAGVSESLVDLGAQLTATAQAVDPDYIPPEGDCWSMPLAEQTDRVLFPSGRAEALEREVAAVSAVTSIEPAMCEALQQGMERAVNADRIAWRRSHILTYDQDGVSAKNRRNKNGTKAKQKS